LTRVNNYSTNVKCYSGFWVTLAGCLTLNPE